MIDPLPKGVARVVITEAAEGVLPVNSAAYTDNRVTSTRSPITAFVPTNPLGE